MLVASEIAAAPLTGLSSVAVQLSHAEGGVVLSIHDPDELTVLDRVAAHLGGEPRLTVVVDVSELTMAPRRGVEALVGHVRAAADTTVPHRWSLVAGRRSARRVLLQLCTGTEISVHPSVAVALASTVAVDR